MTEIRNSPLPPVAPAQTSATNASLPKAASLEQRTSKSDPVSHSRHSLKGWIQEQFGKDKRLGEGEKFVRVGGNKVKVRVENKGKGKLSLKGRSAKTGKPSTQRFKSLGEAFKAFKKFFSLPSFRSRSARTEAGKGVEEAQLEQENKLETVADGLRQLKQRGGQHAESVVLLDKTKSGQEEIGEYLAAKSKAEFFLNHRKQQGAEQPLSQVERELLENCFKVMDTVMLVQET